MEGHDKTTGEQLRAGIAENKPAQPGEDGSLAASTARGASGAASHGLAGDTELPLDATRRAGSYGRHPVPPEEEGFYSPDTEASDGQVHCEKGVTHPAVASHCGAGLPAAEASLQAPPHVSQPQASPFQRGDAPASSIVDSRSPLQAPISSAADGGPNSPPARPNRLSYSPFPSVSSSWTSLGAPCGGRAGGDPGGGVSQWLDMTCAAFASSSFPSFALTRVLARTPSAVSSSHVNPVDGNASVTPQDLHACVGSRRCQIALCLGKKQRCNPLQNLDCPIAFAVVKLLKEGRRDRPAAGPETQGGEDVTRESLAEETPGSAMQRSSPCPTETADAALVIFKGKFATLVLNGIVTVEDVLVMEGLRCRPFFRPGRKEDLYSWAAESLHQLRASQTWGGGEETDPALRRVCVTHYLTLSDVYDDAKITVRPFAPSSAALPAFTLSAPELVTCCAFPASLPLPDWLLARNAQAPRSIFAARVLRRSNELKRARARAAGSRPPQGEPGGGEGECGGREGLGGGRREGGAQTAAPRGAREGAAEAEYVYTDLANLQANRGTNLYGVVWEVAKALMPQAGGKSQTGPAVFLMNVAIFDETVKFDLGRDTAPGGASEEFSLALKAKGCPGDIPCMSCGDIVRVHRANTGMKFEHDRNFVNLSSIIGVTSARVWPLEDADSDPCADNGFVVGAEVTTHFTEDDACRIRALRYHAQQLLQDNQLFTTQYYKPLAVLQRCSSGPLMREVYGDLIVRVVRSSMTSSCRVLDSGESESLFSEFAWVRGDSTAPESRQFDAELSAYLLLVEDASLPGGHVAVANLSSASAEHLFASENAIREGDWLRLRNFKWGATRLHDPLFGRIYFSVQPSRSDLARITRLPPFALDAVRAQQELDRALQALMEDDEIPRDASDPKRTRELPPAESEGEADTARRRRTAAERNPRAGLEAAPEREEEIEECAAAEAPEEAAGRDEAEDDSSPLSGGCAPHTRFELFVPQELLDAHGSRVPVYERIDSLVASSSRPASSARRSREGPFLLKAMHVLGLCAAPLAAEASLESGATVDIADPRTWVVVQCLLCRTSRRLSARRPRPPGGEDATGRRAAAARAAHHGRNARGKRAAQEAARRSDEETTDDHEEVLWCPTCKHRDSAMLVVMYDFHLHLADANGTSLVVQVKDAVGRRFRCASERGISPFFAATDRGAQELLQAVLRGLVSEAEQEEESSRPRERKRGLSSPQKRRGRASASSADGAKDDAEADAEADAAGGAKSDQEGGDGAYLIGSSSSSEEEEGEIQTQSLVGRKYMRRRKHLKAGLAGSRGGEACSGPSAPSEQENSKQSHAPRAHREREEEENQKKKRGLGRHDLLVVRRWAEEAAESDRVFENSGAATWVVTGAEIRRA